MGGNGDKYIPLERSNNGSRKLVAYSYTKKKVLERDGYKCVNCKKKAKVTHHLIPVWEDRTKVNDVENIISLCKKCHYDVHYNWTGRR